MRYGGIPSPLESFKNALHIRVGFPGPAGKQVAELASQKCILDLGVGVE